MRIVTDLSIASAPVHPRNRWSPARLFQDGVSGAWYDPEDRATLFQDAEATTPVTATGQPVGHVHDKSGNGHHMTQPDPSARPIYRSAGDIHWLEFDGVDDRMDFATPLDLNTGTAIMGFAEPAGRSAHSVLLSPGNAGYLSIRFDGSERTLSKNDGGRHAYIDAPARFPVTEQSAFAVRVDGGNILARRFGDVEHTNTLTGRNNFNLTTVMAFSSGGALPAAGNVYGMILLAGTPVEDDVDHSLQFINARMTPY